MYTLTQIRLVFLISSVALTTLVQSAPTPKPAPALTLVTDPASISLGTFSNVRPFKLTATIEKLSSTKEINARCLNYANTVAAIMNLRLQTDTGDIEVTKDSAVNFLKRLNDHIEGLSATPTRSALFSYTENCVDELSGRLELKGESPWKFDSLGSPVLSEARRIASKSVNPTLACQDFVAKIMGPSSSKGLEKEKDNLMFLRYLQKHLETESGRVVESVKTFLQPCDELLQNQINLVRNALLTKQPIKIEVPRFEPALLPRVRVH